MVCFPGNSRAIFDTKQLLEFLKIGKNPDGTRVFAPMSIAVCQPHLDGSRTTGGVHGVERLSIRYEPFSINRDIMVTLARVNPNSWAISPCNPLPAKRIDH